MPYLTTRLYDRHGFDAVEAEGAFLLAEVAPADEIVGVVAGFDPVGGDPAGGDVAVAGTPVTEFDVVALGEGGADDGFGIGGGGQVPGGELEVAVEGGLQLIEEGVGGAFGAGLLEGGELLAQGLA